MNGRQILSVLIALTGALLLDAAAVPTIVYAQGRPSTNPRLNAIRRPTVSPYLDLLRQNSQFGLPNYQSYVRPQVQQRQVNRQQQAQIRRLQSDVARQGSALRAGSREIRGTGHRSYFMNYSHFYTGLRTP